MRRHFDVTKLWRGPIEVTALMDPKSGNLNYSINRKLFGRR